MGVDKWLAKPASHIWFAGHVNMFKVHGISNICKFSYFREPPELSIKQPLPLDLRKVIMTPLAVKSSISLRDSNPVFDNQRKLNHWIPRQPSIPGVRSADCHSYCSRSLYLSYESYRWPLADWLPIVTLISFLSFIWWGRCSSPTHK